MKANNKLKKLLKGDLGYCDPKIKQQFHSEARHELRQLASRLGLAAWQYDLRSNLGGIAVSGEITLHSDKIYVQISQYFGGSHIMYRPCNGRKDYYGGQNRMAKIERLFSDEFVDELRRMME